MKIKNKTAFSLYCIAGTCSSDSIILTSFFQYYALSVQSYEFAVGLCLRLLNHMLLARTPGVSDLVNSGVGCEICFYNMSPDDTDTVVTATTL